MHPGLIVIMVLVAWSLGPLILRWVGGFFALSALVLAAFGGRHINQLSLLISGLAGTLMWAIGMGWQRGREEGRGPLISSLLVDHIPALRARRYHRRLRYDDHWNQPLPHDEPAGHPRHDPEPQASRWRISFRRRVHEAPPPTSTVGEHSGASGERQLPWERAAEGAVIDGTAHEVSATPEEHEASRAQSLREEVDRTLEEAHRHLEPIIYGLFVLVGRGWRDRLSAARRTRRKDLPEIDGGPRPFEDRRTLFSVIAYDWTLIESAFTRDPSPAGRTLCAIANRYAHEGPREDDPAAARQAFGEICAALRQQSVNRVMHPTKPWLW